VCIQSLCLSLTRRADLTCCDRLEKVGAAEPDSEIVSTATDMLNHVQATLELVKWSLDTSRRFMADPPPRLTAGDSDCRRSSSYDTARPRLLAGYDGRSIFGALGRMEVEVLTGYRLAGTVGPATARRGHQLSRQVVFSAEPPTRLTSLAYRSRGDYLVLALLDTLACNGVV